MTANIGLLVLVIWRLTVNCYRYRDPRISHPPFAPRKQFFEIKTVRFDASFPLNIFDAFRFRRLLTVIKKVFNWSAFPFQLKEMLNVSINTVKTCEFCFYDSRVEFIDVFLIALYFSILLSLGLGLLRSLQKQIQALLFRRPVCYFSLQLACIFEFTRATQC